MIRIDSCGVCGTDLHILKGHWPKPLPWPITLGHELTGVIEQIGPELRVDFMGQPLSVGSKVMLPPLMPCGECYYCVHYPARANKCLNPTYYGRYIPFSKPPHLWGGWAEMVYVDLDMLPGTQGLQTAGRYVVEARVIGRAADIVRTRAQPCGTESGRGGRVSSGRYRGGAGLGPDWAAGACGCARRWAPAG